MPEENQVTVGDNIKKLRKELGITQQKFADRIGIKQNTIAAVETNKRNISEQALLSISREFNVRLEWLKTGEGEMFSKHDPTIIERLARDYDLSDKNRELIENFLKLPPHVRDLVATAVAQAAEFYPRKEKPQAESDFPEHLCKPDEELSPEEAAQIVQYEMEQREAAKKRGTSTSSASTGTNGLYLKNSTNTS